MKLKNFYSDKLSKTSKYSVVFTQNETQLKSGKTKIEGDFIIYDEDSNEVTGLSEKIEGLINYKYKDISLIKSILKILIVFTFGIFIHDSYFYYRRYYRNIVVNIIDQEQGIFNLNDLQENLISQYFYNFFYSIWDKIY